VRTVYPGSSAGIYTAEEVQDMVDVTPPTVPVVDAAPPPPTVLDESERADHLACIDSATDLTELKRAYSTAFAAAKHCGDADALNDFERAKDVRKSQLTDAA